MDGIRRSGAAKINFPIKSILAARYYQIQKCNFTRANSYKFDFTHPAFYVKSNMSFVNKFLHVNSIYTVTISCKIKVLLLVADCCLPPLLPVAATVAAAAPVSIAVIHHLHHCLRLSSTCCLSWTSSHCNRDGGCRHRLCQKGEPCI